MVAKNRKPMLDLFGKRHGNFIVRHELSTMISERTVSVGHIVRLGDNYLECIGFQDDLLLQPRFLNVTLEIQEREAAEADYRDTIASFEMGTGRF